jgi:hypothetical protein
VLPVVSDRLRYGLKPVAVESKQSVITIPALGATTYDGNTSSNIVFRIQHNPSGRYVHPAAIHNCFGQALVQITYC